MSDQTISRTRKAGLHLSVERIHRILKRGKYAKRISHDASVALTAIVEYLTAELLELAGKSALDNRRARITPRDIMLAVRLDEELSELFREIVITSGGVLPNVHKALMSRTKHNTHEDHNA